MELTINVPQRFVDSIQDTPVGLSMPYDVSFNGAAFRAPTVGAVIYPKAMDYFVAMASASHGQNIYSTMHSNGDMVLWLSISRTSTTEIFFETFKKAGIFMSKLTCGLDLLKGKLIISGKLSRELSRASESIRCNVTVYLKTLLHCAKLYALENIEVEPGEGSYVMNFKTSPEELLKGMYVISPEASFEVSSDAPEGVVRATYYTNAASASKSEYTYANQVKHIATSDPNTLVATWTVASNVYTAVLKEHMFFTNHTMYLADLATDSVITFLAEQYDGDVSVEVCDTTGALAGLEVLEVNEDTTVGLNDWAQAWLRLASAKGSVALDCSEYTTLKDTGIKYEASAGSFDRDEIIAQYAEDSYAQELYKQYKAHYDDFKLNQLEPNVTGFAKGDIYSMVFVGESGTGKSTAARVIPHRCGIPYISINFSVNIEESDLFGAMYPNPYKKSADDPEFTWQDGIITKAVRNGYCVILEELNFARPGVLGKLNSLLDENRQVDLSNGEIVRAHPNFRIIATCNIAYEGTNRFNKALINRFDDVTEFVDATREEAIDTVCKRTGYKNRSKINKVYEVYEAVKKFAKEQCVSCTISMRQLLNVFSKGKYYSNALDAVTRIMLNGAFLEDHEYLEMFKETILPAFDLGFKI